MRINLPVTQQNYDYPGEELLVSSTNTKGEITHCNPAFVRVSGYSYDELIGQPHNIIRHPAMPRSVFRLLWDTIQAGQEIFAYINNLAVDCAHYWVFAHVTPSYDPAGQLVGYHSNRRVPERDAVVEAAALYSTLCEVEARYPKPADAIAAGMEEFAGRLGRIGQSYDQFVWGLTRQTRA